MIQFNHTKQKWHICVRVLSLRSSVSWFCDSPDTPVMSCFHVSTLELCTLSSACLLSCWSMVFGSRYSCLEFLFCVGVRTLALHVLSHCVSVFCLEFVRPRALLSTCVLGCCTQFVFLSAAYIHVRSCAVWHAACVFIGCVLSCCHVLCEHVAYEYSH